MINFIKENKKLLIALIVNIILLELMHIYKIHYVLSESIVLFIIFLLKERRIHKKLFTSYIITLFIEVSCTNIIMRFNLPYIITDIFTSLSVFITIYVIEHRRIKKISDVYQNIEKKWKELINTKILKKLFIILPQNLIVFILFVLSIVTIYKYCNNYVNDTGIVYFNTPKEENIEIKEKTKIDLSFIDSDDKFDDICLKISSNNNTKITLSSDKIVKTVNSNKINKYGYLCFKVKNLTVDDLKNSDIYLSSNSVINLYKSEKNQVAIQLARNQKDLTFINITVSVIIIASFLIINYLINEKKIKESKIYLIFSVYFVILLFIFPPYQVPDEVAHFSRAYNYSQPETKENYIFGKEDIEVPENIDCLDYAHIHRSNKVYEINDIERCLKSPNNKVVKNTERTGSQILGYITQSVGIKIADIITNSPLIIFFSGRLLTLIVSIVITYLAIKITPKYKTIFLTVATMMMLLQQMISYSYDSILNSVCLLFTAYIIKFIYQDKKITFKNLIVPVLLLIIIANIKMVYLPLSLLFLIVPKEKFGTNKKKLLLFFSIMIIAVLSSKIIDMFFAIEGKENIGPAKQLKYLMNNPLDIIKIAINTVGEKGLFYIESLVGYFGWFMIKLSPLYIYVYIFLYTYLINGEDSKIEKKYFIIISLIFMIIAIFGALYIVWSDYKLPYVEGVQGRYFFPLIIPICLLLIPKEKKYKISPKIVYSIINILLFQYLFIILFTYY